MRVAIDVTSLNGARTGVGTFTAGIVDALARVGGVSVSGYSLSARARGFAALLPPGVDAGRSAPAGLALRAWSRGIALPTAEWLARTPEVKGRLDVVHGTNFVVPPSRGACRVVTVHDLTSVRFPEMCAASSLRYPGLVRRAVRDGAWVHTPSEFVAGEVCEWLGVGMDRVRPVAHGVGPPGDGSGTGDPLVGRSMAGADRYVLALGTVEPRKDLPLLVRAWDDVATERTDLRLVIAGPDGWGVAALEAAISQARASTRIVRVGWVSGPQRLGLLAGASAFAFPSTYEGFGLPPLEAMAAGVPVVACGAGAVPEVVGDGAVVVPVGDQAALTTALASVLDDAVLAGAVGSRGRARAALFTWEASARKMVELYQAAQASVRRRG